MGELTFKVVSMMGWSAATAIRMVKRYGQTESYPETGLWEAPESPSKMPTKVNAMAESRAFDRIAFALCPP
jgi:hypothetical protein